MKIEAEIAGYKIHPAAQVFPPMKDEEFEALCADIAENDLEEPIMLCEYEGETVILDGRHRLLACLEWGMKVEDIAFDTYKGDSPVTYVASRNRYRRHLTPSQLAMIAVGLKPLFVAEAKKRQEATQFGAEESDDTVRETFPTPQNVEESSDSEQETGRARDQAGSSMGVSGRTVAKAEKVIDGGCDELQEAARNGMVDVTIGEKIAKRPVKEQRQILKKIEEHSKKNAKSVLRQHDKGKVIAKLKKEPSPPPEGPFRVITADVAWKFDKRPDDGTQRGQTPYPGMELKEIFDLGEMVKGFAHEDCILWFWTTNAHLPVAFSVLDNWGFVYKTCLTWKKPKMGTGDWLRGITEHCLLAVRGKPTVDLGNQSTIIEGKVREHSRKPEEFYKLVEGLCPGSKLEMFATDTTRPGWQFWAPGNWRETEEK
jgi:N6-adenosine-specific RNA methylase IME4